MTKYRHTLVYRIDGVHLGAREGEVEVISDPTGGFRAVLTTDPDSYCFEGDRFAACADEDVERFRRAKEVRDELTHGQDIREANLPVQAVQELVRRYLRLHLTS
jgi:hypothetical protein